MIVRFPLAAARLIWDPATLPHVHAWSLPARLIYPIALQPRLASSRPLSRPPKPSRRARRPCGASSLQRAKRKADTPPRPLRSSEKQTTEALTMSFDASTVKCLSPFLEVLQVTPLNFSKALDPFGRELATRSCGWHRSISMRGLSVHLRGMTKRSARQKNSSKKLPAGGWTSLRTMAWFPRQERSSDCGASLKLKTDSSNSNVV